MNERIAGINQQQIQGAEAKSPPSDAPPTGVYQGENVTQVIDIQSLIEDAFEELTFSASENVEKKMAEREITSPKDRLSEIRKAMEKYLRQVPDIGSPEKVKKFLEHIKRANIKTPSQIKEEVQKFFRDVTHQYTALLIARDSLKDEGLKQLVKDAADSLLEEKGPEIRAGLNVSQTARAFSEKGLADTQALRDFYRESVLNYESLSQLHSVLTSAFDGQDFEQAVAFLIEAVGNDLRSQGPSISPAHLKKVIDDLYCLEVLGNFHRDCRSLMGDVRRIFGLSPRISPEELANRVLKMKEEKWFTASVVENLADVAGMTMLDARIFFLTELKGMVRKIPIKVFDSLDQRENFLNAIQEALDISIEKEE